MALLPKVPWTDIDDSRVATDAPVSTDLWTDTVVDLNYLKAVLTDGAGAPQDINVANATVNGTLTVTGNTDLQGTLDVAGNAQFDSDLNIDGTFKLGGEEVDVFANPDQIYSNNALAITNTTITLYTVPVDKKAIITDLLIAYIDTAGSPQFELLLDGVAVIKDGSPSTSWQDSESHNVARETVLNTGETIQVDVVGIGATVTANILISARVIDV